MSGLAGLKTIETVRVNEIDFACQSFGEGPLVLCLHGFPDTALSYDAVAPGLAAAGYRVVVPFMRGYFPTGLAPDGDYSMTALAEDALGLIDAFGEKDAVVIGHDWGGFAAILAANLAPERVSKLVVSSLPHMHSTRFSLAQLRRSWYVMFFQLPRLPERAIRKEDYAFIERLYGSWCPSWSPPADELKSVKASLAAPGGLEAALGYYRGFVRQTKEQYERLSEPTTVPSLCFAGDEDGCVGIEQFRDIGLCYPNLYGFVRMEHVGHFPHRERPKLFLEKTLKFLNS